MTIDRYCYQRIFVFIYLLPAFQATVFNVTLGHEPKGLKMAIVNEELDPNQGRVCNYSTDCSYSMLSCRYLRYIKDNIVQVCYCICQEGVILKRNLNFILMVNAGSVRKCVRCNGSRNKWSSLGRDPLRT